MRAALIYQGQRRWHLPDQNTPGNDLRHFDVGRQSD